MTIEGLVLRVTPYSETSLILVLLTREAGQQHFLLRGARKTGKKAFPAADLFRCLTIGYRPSTKTDLQTAREVDLVRTFDAVARQTPHYLAAGWLARFALENSVANEPAPLLYEALLTAFERLARPEPQRCVAIALGVGFAALDEHGLQPDLAGRESSERQMRRMLDYAVDSRLPEPEYDEATWGALAEWMYRYLHRVGLHVPEGWAKLGNR